MIIHTSEIAISRLPHIQLDSSFPLRDIVHMILAGGPAQTLYNLSTGVHQRAVEYLSTQAEGAIGVDHLGMPCFTMDPPRRSNETLGIFAIAGVRFDRVPLLHANGDQGTLQDLVDSAMKSIRNDASEKSWSLMLFSVEPGVSSEWTNYWGELCSVETLLQSELSQDYGRGTCFGSHRLEGIAFALRKFCLEYDVEPSQLKGVWLDAHEYLQRALHLIRQNQADDGTLPRWWFRKNAIPRSSVDLIQAFHQVVSFRNADAALVYSTGHLLDAISPLADFLPQENDWMQRASYILAQTIDNHWTKVGREIGALTRAIHALKLLDV